MTNGADPLFQALLQKVCISDTSVDIKLVDYNLLLLMLDIRTADIQILLILQYKLTVIN